MSYYRITKAQADLIGRFEYRPNHFFDPYSNEQKDGTYLVSEEMYRLLADNERMKAIDFTKLDVTSIKNEKETSKPVKK